MPGAPNVERFWENLKSGTYSITEVDADRWDPELYFSPDPETEDATYSKIGGWVRDWEWKPFDWKLPIPPKVGSAMDEAQRWGIACTRSVLEDYGYPEKPLDADRTAVILGNAMAGEKHYQSALRVSFPEIARELEEAESFRELPEDLRNNIIAEARAGLRERIPQITEDSMPGELANVMAGRIANLFNFHGPNYVVDAACASAMAAMSAAVEGLEEHDYDAVITGGIDRNMGASTFVKFCKIGALSATGTRPYADGADGFVMGEGAALFLLKRLEDAERDGDHVYAVLRGMGGSSDGKGKGITAPNPVGQKLAVQRAWENAGLSPSTASYVEGHGTSTRVGDVVEVESLTEVFASAGAQPNSVALGSVKSNIGHLKGAAGAAGILKTVLALNEKVLPPSLNCGQKNPNIDFEHSPFYVSTELTDWAKPPCGVRRAGVSAFGFGGTNFHAVLEEYIPGRLTTDRRKKDSTGETVPGGVTGLAAKAPLSGAIVLGADTAIELATRLRKLKVDAEANRELGREAPLASDLAAPERIAIDFKTPGDLARKIDLALKAFERDDASVWTALTSQGVFRGSGEKQKVAFLYPGQGSQYLNMLSELRAREPAVRAVFEQADRIMRVHLDNHRLSDFVFTDADDEKSIAAANDALRQTEITQPAMLTADAALTELLDEYGVQPDMVMGHSLGEYAALVQAGVLTLAEALEAVSARGREMASVAVEDNGKMAAVFAPLTDIQRVLASIDGYVVIANINSNEQAVIGGESAAIDDAIERFSAEGMEVVPLPVSHAFHTRIVAPASEPLKAVLSRMQVREPVVPIISNVTGKFYETGEGAADKVIDGLGKQIASPVQFVNGLNELYDAGVRVFVEVGPKKALKGFVDNVLGDKGDVVSLFVNHPKTGATTSFNQALCGLYAAGHGAGREAPQAATVAPAEVEAAPAIPPAPPTTDAAADALRRLFNEFVERGQQLLAGGSAGAAEHIVVSGAALGLPGTEKVFDDDNVGRILHGEQFIDVIPYRLREAMAEKHITRLVKPEHGDPTFVSIDDTQDVVKLGGRAGKFDVAEEFGVKPERARAFDSTTAMAVAVGLDALRDAGIPLVLSYKTTTTGSKLPERWRLPDALRDDTGIIFASAFPGFDAFSEQLDEYYAERGHREQLESLESMREWLAHLGNGSSAALEEVDRRIAEVKSLLDKTAYHLDRRFLFRILSMGHSQFAEEIGARGPNTQVNGACASTTQAVALAEDWIRGGRCKRVIVLSADNVTSDHMMEWIGAGFLASGAAATDENPKDAATPFDRRRHGMIAGMGAAALVIETADATRARGLQPIAEVLGSVTANSAFHGTRLDINHIAGVMEDLVARAEQRHGIAREQIAPQTMFMSHETYTPARGGSASAEIHALRSVFGNKADQIVISNTKGFTGHAMGAGIEDVVAIKALETGIVPPVPNFKEVDPELGNLNLSTGGSYPVQYALRLGAGFGSQLAMTLVRWMPSPDGRRRNADRLGFDYRIADRARWQEWLNGLSGYDHADLEVEHRRLRVRDQGPPVRATARADLRPEPVRAVVPEPPAPLEAVPSATPAAPQAAPEPVAAAPAPALDDVEQQVIRIVAEKTDYPPDMLALDLDLEADLGVDTVKQAEVFAEIRGHYDIPRDENLKLSEFPTLAHVVGFVRDRRPDQPKPAAPAAVEQALAEAPPVESAGTDDAAIRQRVLTIVGEMTGYPEDMLDMDLDLEADLGVDTVKQAEIFAALREAYDIPRDPDLKLGDFPTLNHALQFVKDRMPAGDATAASAAAATEASAVADTGTTIQVPRRVPTAVWRPPLELCKPTGVGLTEGMRVIVMPDNGGVGHALIERLQKRGVEVLALDPGSDSAAVAGQVAAWVGEGPVSGLYWLAALDAHDAVAQMDDTAWNVAVDQRIKALYEAMWPLYEGLQSREHFVVAATRMGGRHGYDAHGALNPLGGAVCGFVKAIKRERNDVLCKVVDFAASRKTAALAEQLIDETLGDPGVVEVGIDDAGRWTIGLHEVPRDGSDTGLELNSDSVFVVTGAAGSIVSAIVADLASTSGGTFHLLDLAAKPDAEDPDIALFVSDRDGLKRNIFERIKAGGERATPAMVDKELARIERAEAALSAIQAIEKAGGNAHYHSVDLTDSDAVSAVMTEILASHDRIDVLMHAAGVEISRMLSDKPREEFDLVFDVKSSAWHSLMHAIGDTPLGAAVVFSSVAGRFGNGGQTDYSAANDFLTKCVMGFSNSRPETRGLAIDWTAWGGIGMATRGSIPTMMAAAGIDMLPPQIGIPVVRRELTQGPIATELVVGGRLGVLTSEWDETGGIDVGAIDMSGEHGPMLGDVVGMSLAKGLTVETELDPETQAFLYDHRIDGTPVLPGVMGLEAFAELATLLLPDHRVESIDDAQFLAPFKFYRNEPRKVRVTAQFAEVDGQLVAYCTLEGERRIQTQPDPVVTTHFTATVRLTQADPETFKVERPVTQASATIDSDAVYQVYFHGPAYQVLESAWGGESDTAIGRLANDLPANHSPPDLRTLIAPRVIELCFQTAGMYELGVDGRFGLPAKIGRVQMLKEPRITGMQLYTVVRHRDGGPGFDADVVDESGDVFLRLQDYQTVELPGAADAAAVDPIRAVFRVE
jgi:malonyl CoA-acyl carrier protein transacylase